MSKISKEELSQSLLNELKNVDGNESSVQIKRVSTKTQLPSRLDVGEPVYVNDESELYIGTDSGNIKLTNRTEMNSIGSQITDIVIEGNSVIVNQSNEEVSIGTPGATLKSVGEDYELKLYNLDPGVHVFTKKILLYQILYLMVHGLMKILLKPMLHQK